MTAALHRVLGIAMPGCKIATAAKSFRAGSGLSGWDGGRVVAQVSAGQVRANVNDGRWCRPGTPGDQALSGDLGAHP